MATLARKLNGIRHHNLILKDLIVVRKAKRDAKRKISELVKSLERVKEEEQKFLDLAIRASEKPSANVLRNRIQEIQEHILWAKICNDSDALSETGLITFYLMAIAIEKFTVRWILFSIGVLLFVFARALAFWNAS